MSGATTDVIANLMTKEKNTITVITGTNHMTATPAHVVIVLHVTDHQTGARKGYSNVDMIATQTATISTARHPTFDHDTYYHDDTHCY